MTTHDYGQGAGTLTAAMAKVADARTDLDTIAAQIESRVTGEQAHWRGAGGGAFFALQAAWQDKQRSIVRALDGFAEALAATEKVNVATDTEQQSVMTRLASRLG